MQGKREELPQKGRYREGTECFWIDRSHLSGSIPSAGSLDVVVAHMQTI